MAPDRTAETLALHANKIVEKEQARVADSTVIDGNLPVGHGQTDGQDEDLTPPAVKRVAVIGAGVSGLRVAMSLGLTHQVDVFEASENVGGRLYTHKFKDAGEWDYFDVGAMRFPKTKVMDSTFKLFDELDLPRIKYHMSSDESFLYYNNQRKKRKEADGYSFGARVSELGNVPDKWVDIGIKRLTSDVYGRFLAALRRNYKEGYAKLLKYDDHSTRSLMAFEVLPEEIDPDTNEVYPKKEKYPVEVINWLETMTFSVGWFDRGFTETVLELLAFADGEDNVDWYCIPQGSQVITDTMKKRLQSEKYQKNVTFHLLHQTTAVECDTELEAPLTISGTYKNDSQTQQCKHEPETQTCQHDTTTQTFKHTGYTQVVLAISPQAMRYIDLKTCHLDYGQRAALLMLQPGPSIKIGMKFETNWWGKLGITGGQSTTDRPVRTVVYPSHGGGESKVLIASYCWTQDATTMGALMQGDKSPEEEILKKAVIRDLADVHGVPYEDLYKGCTDMYAYNWNNNPRTMGAFAFFGPGQFSSLFGNLTRPAADGRLHFAGEAVSTCHAWVAGAVDSADRVVGTMFPKRLVEGRTAPASSGDAEERIALPQSLLSSKLILKQLRLSSRLQHVSA